MILTKTGRAAAIARPDKPTAALPSPPAIETPVMRATRSMLAKMDAQRTEIARLRSALLAALA